MGEIEKWELKVSEREKKRTGEKRNIENQNNERNAQEITKEKRREQRW